MRFTSIFAGAAVAAASLVLVACGGGGGGDKALSHSDLVAKANAICKDGDKRISKFKQPSDASDPTQVAPYLQESSAVIEDEAGKLHDLKPADSDKAKYDAFLSKLDDARAQLDAILAKAKKKDATGQSDLNNFTSDYGDPVDRAADAAGLKAECGTGSDDASNDSTATTATVAAPPAPTLTHDQYVSAANAICKGFSKQSDAIKQPSDISDPSQAASYLTEVSVLAKAQSTQLHAITPPAEDAPAYATFLAKFDAALGEVDKLAGEAKAGDASGLKELQSFDKDYSDPSDNAADAAGVDECGTSSGT